MTGSMFGGVKGATVCKLVLLYMYVHMNFIDPTSDPAYDPIYPPLHPLHTHTSNIVVLAKPFRWVMENVHEHCIRRGVVIYKWLYILSSQVEQCPYLCQNGKKAQNRSKLDETPTQGSVHTNSKEHRGSARGRISRTDKQTHGQTSLEYYNID